jgi:hypothetical protein
MKKLILSLILFGTLSGLDAQKGTELFPADKIALQIPDSLTNTTYGIASYINSNFSSQKDKSRAIFIWIAKNIQYDIENMYAINFYQSPKELVDKVLSSKKGICMHFAELFKDLAEQVGIKSYVISGYTKQNGFVDYIPHAWCAGLVDSTWVFFDPTWGSGYVQNAKFIRQVNNLYFMTKPEQLIKSHMPFDPLWQFLNYPITNQEFYESKFQINKTKPFLNYNDTLSIYETDSEIERLLSSSRRIESNGVKNSLIFDRLQHNKREIEYYNNKMIVERFNSATNMYNEGIGQLNAFINYRNNLFNPKRTDSEIKQMVEEVEISFKNSFDKLKEIKSNDPNIATSVMQLNKSIEEARLNLDEQKVFLDKYFSTGKVFRKSLFYKYTWMGIPIGK